MLRKPNTPTPASDKTITLQTLVESFTRLGVPVFMAEVKGELTGNSQASTIGGKIAAILKERGIATPPSVAHPTTLWDVFACAQAGGQQERLRRPGHPARTTVSEGARAAAAVHAWRSTRPSKASCGLVFKIADDVGMLPLDLEGLRVMLQCVGDNAAQFTTEYGNCWRWRATCRGPSPPSPGTGLSIPY